MAGWLLAWLEKWIPTVKPHYFALSVPGNMQVDPARSPQPLEEFSGPVSGLILRGSGGSRASSASEFRDQGAESSEGLKIFQHQKRASQRLPEPFTASRPCQGQTGRPKPCKAFQKPALFSVPPHTSSQHFRPLRASLLQAPSTPARQHLS